MSIDLEDGTVRLAGDCGVEDAETLLRLLQEHAGPIDVEKCGRLHLAVMQILLAAQRPVHGVPANAFARQWLLPLLT